MSTPAQPRDRARPARPGASVRSLPVLQPHTIEEALAVRAERPDALAVAGGTGVLPWLNAGLEPPALLDLSRVDGARDADTSGDVVRLGAGVTYTQVLESLADSVPGLAQAAATVASRQVRNRGTLAGALVLADPSGDALAALGAAGAELELRSARGARSVPAHAFVSAPGECALAGDELLVALHVPRPRGPVAYAKVGARNAMARAVCGVAVVLDPGDRSARACVVGASPSPVVLEAGWDDDLPAAAAAAVDPEPDARGSSAYRRRAAHVLTGRALARAREAL